MGTTIRREPVNFAIPAAPDYKFLNITNFRGLDVSSNPFELANNTASDCLNVYVDETNTLTTRPRLERKITQPMNGTHIATYNLHNGYLLHYLQDGEGVMRKLIAGVSTEITGTIPTVKCKYFEQGDKIYLLDRSRYMVIDEYNALSDVEGYVPTTAVVDLNGVRHNVEPLNLLTDKYVEKYHWNNLRTQDFPDNVVITNESFKLKNRINQTILRYYSDNSVVTDNGGIFNYIPDCLADTLDFQEIVSVATLGTYQFGTYSYYMSKSIEDKTLGIVDGVNGKIHYYTYNNSFWEHTEFDSPVGVTTNLETIENGFGFNNEKSLIWIKNNGKFVFYKFNTNNNQYETYLSQTTALEDFIAVEGNLKGEIVAVTKNTNSSVASFVYYEDVLQSTTHNKLISNIKTTPILSTYGYGISTNGDVCWGCDYYGNITIFTKMTKVENNVAYEKFDDENPRKISAPQGVNVTGLSFDDVTKTSWFTDSITQQLYYCFDYNTDTYHNTRFRTAFVVIPEKLLLNASGVYVWDISAGAAISVETTLSDTDDWQSKREQFFQSYLNTRFDNNYWFASKNRYYRSANNDPTYFPITEYNDLGDSNEEITGFNLANDTTLIAYKKNRVYLIQPFTSSLDTTEYAITESKNTVGNTAFGSPIVTTLTEIPLQINNDGIYGLSQLSNVSATERIADLMSEPINERWLNIDDTLITNAQTLNRLYWTYIILSDNDNKQTMIYLLDNRSNSWYYWELPIVVSDSFVKDNRAEFVDVAGNIYYLTTTDIIDINYDEEKVTKYYDDGKQLIPWFWQSQVLPMGTMNYSKRLVNTTFILTDTDDSDGYGLQYNFKVFRKLASSTPEKEISDKLTLVRSTTKKTNISKFGFLQMRISNLTEESRDYEAYENNKLRLVGLGLKYVLLEGLIR